MDRPDNIDLTNFTPAEAIITKEDCIALCKEIKLLKQQNEFYAKTLTFNQLSTHTGIALGTISVYISYEKLPPSRYTILRSYVDEIIKQNKELIEADKPIE